MVGLYQCVKSKLVQNEIGSGNDTRYKCQGSQTLSHKLNDSCDGSIVVPFPLSELTGV